MNEHRTPLDRISADPAAEQGASEGILHAIDNARRKAVQYGASDILVVLRCPDKIEVAYAVGGVGPSYARELAQELRRVADRIYPVDEHGIGEQTRKHLAVALRDALKALEGA